MKATTNSGNRNEARQTKTTKANTRKRDATGTGTSARSSHDDIIPGAGDRRHQVKSRDGIENAVNERKADRNKHRRPDHTNRTKEPQRHKQEETGREQAA